MYTCIEGGVSVCVLKVVLVHTCVDGGASVYMY